MTIHRHGAHPAPRPTVRLLSAVLLGFSCVPVLSVENTSSGPRNILLIVTDDQSPTAGCYGNPTIQTPHLDALAREGMLFTHACCTTASCSASRSVILSGLFNHATGQYGHMHSYHHFQSHASLRTLPALLAKMGYRTARIGKFHVAPESVYPFEAKIRGHARNPVQMAEACQDFLQSNDARPFFLYFCTSDPHRGGGRASELPYQPNRFGNKPRGESYPGVSPRYYTESDVRVPYFLPDTSVCRAELAQYYQSITRIDQGLGALLRVLRESGHYDDTLIVYTSDHGMAFPGGKTNLYEGGMRIPLVVRAPGVTPRGATTPALVSLADITPTLLDYAGGLEPGADAFLKRELAGALVQAGQPVPEPRRFHGRSFLPVLDDPTAEGFGEIYASHTFHEIQMYYPMRVVRTRQFKLIWNIAHPLPFPFASDLWAAPTWQAQYKQGPQTNYGQRTVGEYMHRPEFELYDLQTDPHETHNLAEDSQSAQTLKQLKAKLKAFQQRTGDGWILKWKYE